jgi:rhodanese-related sulfurtransferase
VDEPASQTPIGPTRDRRQARAVPVCSWTVTRPQWHAGRAAAAVHIPLGQLAGRADELSRDQPVFLICASGNRSRVAAQILRNAGFQRAVNVRGGTIAWMRSGLPMTR